MQDPPSAGISSSPSTGRFDALAAEFEKRFAGSPAFGVRAPGRVNLIGEHTDYNEGLVLPCAIDRDTRVLAAPRSDRRLRVFSLDLDAEAELDLDRLERRGSWLDYVQAPAFALAENGTELRGADLGIASAVPRESGLSSSAALGVGITLALARIAGTELGPLDAARIAHRGENAFVGVGCGIMDQFASALGRRDHALHIDCRSQVVTPVPLPAGRCQLLVARSGVQRQLAKGGYGDRVAECAAALDAAREAGIAAAGARALRDLDTEDLPALEAALPAPLLRRARHVIRENQRVEDFCASLHRGDLEGAGSLLREGMASLRDDFEVSVDELDVLCAAGDAQSGCYGSRLTGAGFGGCTLHLVDPDAADAVAEAIARAFERRFGRRPEVLSMQVGDGASYLL